MLSTENSQKCQQGVDRRRELAVLVAVAAGVLVAQIRDYASLDMSWQVSSIRVVPVRHSQASVAILQTVLASSAQASVIPEHMHGSLMTSHTEEVKGVIHNSMFVLVFEIKTEAAVYFSAQNVFKNKKS